MTVDRALQVWLVAVCVTVFVCGAAVGYVTAVIWNV